MELNVSTEEVNEEIEEVKEEAEAEEVSKRPAKPPKKTPAKKTTAKKKVKEEVPEKVDDSIENIDGDDAAEVEVTRDRKIISQSGHKRVQTEEDKYNDSLIDLFKSSKAGQILTGVVEGVEVYNSNLVVAVLHRGPFKIVIPSTEFIEKFPKYNPGMGYGSETNMIRIMMSKRIGAEVDFLIKGEVDTEEDVAMASRTEAMKRKRKNRYIKSDGQGNKFMYEGAQAEARVQAVTRSGIIVEIQGVETFIPLQELSYTRCRDAGELYSAGDLDLAKIEKITIGEGDNVEISASIKATKENPVKKLLPQLQKGGMYGGYVTMVTVHGVFVVLDNGVECLCKYPSFGNNPVGGARAVVKITAIDYDRLRIMGTFTSVQLPKEA